MGLAEVISLSEVRASSQWQRLRDDLHIRFDQWLDRLQEQLPNPQTRFEEHSVILTAHRKPFYNREKRNPSPIAQDFRWA